MQNKVYLLLEEWEAWKSMTIHNMYKEHLSSDQMYLIQHAKPIN